MTRKIHYSIVPVDPAAHVFRVTLTVADPEPSGQAFRLPTWIPGSYMIREFAKNIVSLRATNNGHEIRCEKTGKATWLCEPCDGPLTVIADIYAWDLSVRAAHLDDTHGYFNGTSVFLAVVGQEDRPVDVTVMPPTGEQFSRWRVATTLKPAAESGRWQFGEYVAENYDELVDHPVEMGTFAQASFEACGVPHDIVITGVHRADMNRLCVDLKKICETQLRFFGTPAPMDRYLFQVTVVGDGYGGLEHRASTSLLASRDDLPLAHEDNTTPKESYRNFLGLCSHEYFHTWNVKRIKPAVFLPYDLANEAHTQLLWFFEGATSYYDDLMLVRAGVISPASYLELLARNITRILRSPGRFIESVADASFNAWIKYYRQDENAPNAITSYYVKGALVSLALDLTLRDRTSGERSLDDVMTLLWQRYGQPGIGVPEVGIEKIVEEILGDSSGDFFAKYVHGTDELPLADLLSTHGIVLNLRAAENQSDNGGKPGRPGVPRAALGVRTMNDALGARIQNCFAGGAAMRAGLSANDIIVAIDGLRVTAGNIEKMLGNYRPGETVRVHAFRRDELREAQVTLAEAAPDTCWLTFAGGEVVMTPAARRWLGKD